MARVTRHTKNRGGKHVYSCVASGGCKVAQAREDGSREIRPGDEYYEWSRRFGRSGMTYRQHVECGYPRRTQLSSAKTAAIEDAIQDAVKSLSDWQPAFPGIEDDLLGYAVETDDLDSILSDVAEQAREVASEYEDGVNNMPDALQYSPTAEAMTTVSEELNEWADNIDDWASSVTLEFDPPEPQDDEEADPDAYAEACEAAWGEYLDEIRQAAEDALDGMPEYQG